MRSDGFNALTETGFTKILCNPPYHVDFSVPRHFIEKGFNRLSIGGTMLLVTKRDLWYRNKLRAIFGSVRVYQEASYFVFEANKSSPHYARRQHEVRTLVAGPSRMFICDECVELCTDIIEPEDSLELLRLMRANEESGVADYPALLELARRASTEELAHYVERGRKGLERNRATLQAIERLEMGGGEAPADNNQGSIGGRAAMKRKARRELKRYEDVLSIATNVLGERRQ